MHWFAKKFERGALWAADQDRFEALLMRLAASGTDDYREVLMVSLDVETGGERIYLRLPEPHSHLFPGYDKASAPTAATSLLVGDQTEFERLFRS